MPRGSPARPDRDRTEGDTVDIEDPVIVAIAQRLDVHPAVVCIKWAVQRGPARIPFIGSDGSERTDGARGVIEQIEGVEGVEEVEEVEESPGEALGEIEALFDDGLDSLRDD